MASRGINKVIVVGNLGNDPEMRQMPSGGAVCEISIATSESWKDKQGQMQDRTEWHRVTGYARLAEIMGEYLRKGSQVYIEGSLRTEKWQDKQGNDRYTTKIIARDMQMLGGKPGGGGAAPYDNNQNQNRSQGASGGQGGGYNQGGGNQNRGGGGGYGNQGGGYNQGGGSGGGNRQPAPAPVEDFDDDIPF